MRSRWAPETIRSPYVCKDSWMCGTQKGCLQNCMSAQGLFHMHRCTCISEQNMHLGKLTKYHLKHGLLSMVINLKKVTALIYCSCGKNFGCTLSGCTFLFTVTTMAQSGNYQFVNSIVKGPK